MIELFDTTLRDGTQGEHVSLSAADKIRIAQRLDAFGIHVIEGGWPGSNPKDQDFFERARDVDWQQAQLCAFGATRRAGCAPEEDANLQALVAAHTPTVSLFGKSWTLHAEVALGISLEENLDLIRSSIAFLKAQQKRLIYDAEHFFDGYKADPGYALATLEAAAEAGADVLVLCDTNGGTLPMEVAPIVRAMCAHFDLPIGVHMHNDAECAVANTLVAVAAGARHVQGTINGIGERCGNANLCSVIPGLQLKAAHTALPEDRLAQLTGLSHFVDEVANLDPIDRAAYVGRSAFAHKGGIHVSAVMKTPPAYEHLPPESVGNRRRVLISDLSGQSNVRYKAAELGIDLADRDEARAAVARIKTLENMGYAFESAEASFELLLRTARGEAVRYFSLDRLRVRTDRDAEGTECAEATIAVRVAGQRSLAVAEGQGPVDAMARALRKVLADFFPHLDRLHLTDYKVRVLTPDLGTAASVRVLIELQDGQDTWYTVGVSHNIIEASWQALADGVRYFLLHNPMPAAPALQHSLEAEQIGAAF